MASPDVSPAHSKDQAANGIALPMAQAIFIQAENGYGIVQRLSQALGKEFRQAVDRGKREKPLQVTAAVAGTFCLLGLIVGFRRANLQ